MVLMYIYMLLTVLSVGGSLISKGNPLSFIRLRYNFQHSLVQVDHSWREKLYTQDEMIKVIIDGR
jgi:hypothetical protein